MTPEAQRIAIAKVHKGYEDFDWLLWCDEDALPRWEGRKLHGAIRSENKWHEVLDYLNDLNAMHEAEKVLMSIDRAVVNYHCELQKVMGLYGGPGDGGNVENYEWYATASQRAEAFLRTFQPSACPHSVAKTIRSRGF